MKIEHVNITVSDPDRTAILMQKLFGWHIRWRGPALNNGQTIHVGTDDQYLALHTGPMVMCPPEGFTKGLPLNHIGIVVDDLDTVETLVLAAGFAPFNHAAYEPGRRFYFLDHDRIEYEIVSYVPGLCHPRA
ncbi:MAG TPA: VOC family protein [Parvibaculum sp.]|jgi:catechol 2,3-dioxygenase-like lactoylglutathione lyase family enzyme